MGRRARWRALAYAAALLWINLYICRDLFFARAGFLNSMHGFWIALAERARGGWFHAVWWPFWDFGMPFEFTYAPLVPGLTAAWAALRHVPFDTAFSSVTGLFYCLAPLTLFLMAWRLTGSPGYSFAAALLYSLCSPAQLLAPEGGFRAAKFWEARRLFLMAAWDDTPHAAALAILPLMVLALARAIETRRLAWCAAAAAAVGAMSLASVFGPVIAALAAGCLLAVLRCDRWRSNLAVAAAIGAWGYLIASPFLSPSLIRAIHQETANSDVEGWTMGSVTALAIAAAGWIVLWPALRRWTRDWTLRFFAVFAWTAASIPMIAAYLNRHFLPQPNRYKFELEMGFALVVVFAARRIFDRLPVRFRFAAALVLLAFAAEQVVHYRRLEKDVTFPRDITRSVEYRAAAWAGQNLRDTRVYLPGSVAQWANMWTDLQQFTGGSFSMAANQMQQNGHAAIVFGEYPPDDDARISLAWLRAFGAGAVGVSARDSAEYWKGFVHPGKFEGRLPVLWREQGVTIYRVPMRSTSLAHVVPEGALVRTPPKAPDDIAEVERYVAALEDPSMPLASLEWDGRNRMRILAAGQVVSVQVSYHPGWRAFGNGKPLPLYRDALGLMWMRPSCSGPCEIELRYDGGWELRLCRWVSAAGLLACALAIAKSAGTRR